VQSSRQRLPHPFSPLGCAVYHPPKDFGNAINLRLDASKAVFAQRWSAMGLCHGGQTTWMNSWREYQNSHASNYLGGAWRSLERWATKSPKALIFGAFLGTAWSCVHVFW